jgi:hypothetical protein
MENNVFQKMNAERNTYSILETVNVFSGERTVLKEFADVIEAPNWTRDGRFLVYNSLGRIYTFELATGAVCEVPSGAAVYCNNDHVLSPDNRQIAVSNHSSPDGPRASTSSPLRAGSRAW